MSAASVGPTCHSFSSFPVSNTSSRTRKNDPASADIRRALLRAASPAAGELCPGDAAAHVLSADPVGCTHHSAFLPGILRRGSRFCPGGWPDEAGGRPGRRSHRVSSPSPQSRFPAPHPQDSSVVPTDVACRRRSTGLRRDRSSGRFGRAVWVVGEKEGVTAKGREFRISED